MARSYYKDGMPLAVKDRKEKFARYNIDRDLNHTFYSYQLKGGSTFSAGDDEDLGSTFSEFLSRIRLGGDTEIIMNLTKDKNLFPAGRLRGVRGQGNEAPVYATDGEGAVFSNSENISMIAKQDIINLGGKDQLRFITEDELTTPDTITGDKRNVGLIDPLWDSSVFDGYAVDLPDGEILAWDVGSNEFYIIEDTSTEVSPGNFIRTSVGNLGITTLHDVRKPYSVSNFSFYVAIHDDLKFTIFDVSSNNEIDILLTGNISSGQGTKRPQLTLTDNNVFYILANDIITKVIINLDDPENITFATSEVSGEGVETIGSTNNNVFGWKRELYKRTNSDWENNDYSKNLNKKNVPDDTGITYARRVSERGYGSENVFLIQDNDNNGYIVRKYDYNNDAVINDSVLIPVNSFASFDRLEYNPTSGVYVLYLDSLKKIISFDEGLNIISETTVVDGFGETYDLGFNVKTGNFYVTTFNPDTIINSEIKVLTLNPNDGSIIKGQVFDDTNFASKTFSLVGEFLFTDDDYYFEADENDVFIKKNYPENYDTPTYAWGDYIVKTITHNEDYSIKDMSLSGGVWESGVQASYKMNGVIYKKNDGLLEVAYIHVGSDSTGNTGVFVEKTENTFMIIKQVSNNWDIEILDENLNRILYIDEAVDGNKLSLGSTGLITLSDSGGLGDSFYFLNTGGNYTILNIYKFNNLIQYFKRWDNSLNFIEDINVPNANYELFSNFAKRNHNGKVLFGFGGAVVSIDDNNAILYSELIAENGNSTELINVTDIEEDPQTSTLVGMGMPWSKNFLREIKTINEGSKIVRQNNIFALSQTLVYIISPQTEPLSIDGIDYYFTTTNQFVDEEYRQDGLEIGGLWTRISRFGNEQIYIQGFGISEVDGTIRGGIQYNKWSESNPDDVNIPALGQEDRSEDILGTNDVFGQQIYLTRNIRMTPTGDGSANHYSYDASRVDLPKFKNNEGKYVQIKFLLDAAIKGVNVKYLDIDFEAFANFNQIQFLDDNDNIVPFEIADTNWETRTHLRDEELLNPDLFNDGQGNQAWNLMKAYPIVNGSEIKWEYWDVTTLRYYEALFDSIYQTGSNAINVVSDVLEVIPFVGVTQGMADTMIKNAQYLQVNSLVPFRKFSGEFLNAMYAGTVGSQPNGENGNSFATVDGNYGLDVADNRFYSFNETAINIPDRRWPFTEALMIQDSFQINGILGVAPDYFLLSKPILNPKLFNEDGSHTDLYKQLKNDFVQGIVTWNGTVFSNKFSEENGGQLSTIVKDGNVSSWQNISLEDPKFLVMVPNTIEEVADAIKRSETGESPQIYKEVAVNEGILSGTFNQRVTVPVAEGMYSRLDQRPFTSEGVAAELGLRTNSKLRLIFPTETSPTRIRIPAYGGNIWTLTEWDSNFNLAIDADGDEVVPRGVQSPNVSLEPNSSFKDILLEI